jgi:hypothetical protein
LVSKDRSFGMLLYLAWISVPANLIHFNVLPLSRGQDNFTRVAN